MIILFFTSCATVPLTPPELDRLAKEFNSHPDKAIIYIVRPEKFRGSHIIHYPRLDQKMLGGLKDGTYGVVEVEPGPHQVRVLAEENVGVVKLETEAGRLYFVRIQSVMGTWAPRVSVDLLSEEQGKELVRVGQRAQMLEQLSSPKR